MTRKQSVVTPRVRAEQIRILVGHLPLVIIGTLFATGFVLFLLQETPRHGLLIPWCAAVGALLLLRLLFYLRYREQILDVDAALRRGYLLVAFALLSGMLWALLPPLFVDGNDTFNTIVITVILLGMVCGSFASESVFLPAFIAYTLPVMFSLSTTLLLQGGMYDYLGPIGYVFFTAITGFAVIMSRAQRHSIEQRFENLELLRNLDMQKREAERASTAKSRFLAAASHDLRQPLHALGLYLASLRAELRTPRQRELADKIITTSDALGELLQCLLDISRLDAGIIEPVLKHFSLEELFARLVDTYAPQAQARGLSFSVSGDTATVYSDPILLERILDNLVSNAVRYTNQGGVSVVAENVDGRISISVRDTGEGIPAEEHENVFDEFHQLQNPERDRSKGLGLGLAIVRRLCLLLEYPLSFKSETGQGSLFQISVNEGDPLKRLAVDEGDLPSLPGQHDLRILVIDDEIGVRDAMRELLTGWGFDVRCAGDLEEARRIRLLGYIPQLLICDYRLRDGQTGIAAAQSLREAIGEALPVILITGDLSADRLQEASGSGYTLLHKPVNPALLRTVIDRLMAAALRSDRVAQRA